MSLDIGDDVLVAMTRLHNLKSVSVRGCSRITSAGLALLSPLMGLQQVNLIYNMNVTAQAAHLAPITTLTNLRALAFGNLAGAARDVLFPYPCSLYNTIDTRRMQV